MSKVAIDLGYPLTTTDGRVLTVMDLTRLNFRNAVISLGEMETIYDREKNVSSPKYGRLVPVAQQRGVPDSPSQGELFIPLATETVVALRRNLPADGVQLALACGDNFLNGRVTSVGDDGWLFFVARDAEEMAGFLDRWRIAKLEALG